VILSLQIHSRTGTGRDARRAAPTPEPSPVGPPAPAPPAPVGGSASGGSGLFFFGLAALLALAGLAVPRVISTVRTATGVAGPQPFLCLLERPG
jgi:hypothetical protein